MTHPRATDLPDDMFLVHTDDGAAQPTLSFRRSPNVLLTFAANRFTRITARDNQQRFGIGAMDWRMLVMLTRAPGSSVSEAARTIGIDKAAVSRSLVRLEKAGLVRPDPDAGSRFRKRWVLSDDGVGLHAKMLAASLERQKHLLAGFTRDEVDQFTDYLSRFLANLDGLDDSAG